ncbi:cupin domain-containing protein [Saccharospirillum impatiens]|uniref:cupin domain-containing protein n=1 Tax=Saccharospirillum impatiens TaxID=169438 RepID=UPI0004053EE7|nr:cupin domain-containing protein [Saccharospirillum impatiens]
MIALDPFWRRLYESRPDNALSARETPVTALNADLSQPAIINTERAQWVPSPAPGVQRIMLERNGGEKTTRATSLVAYEPNSRFDGHTHPLGEEFLVLAGVFSDESGDYPAGTYVRNPPGSDHKPFSETGCLILVKLQQFRPDDQTRLVIEPTATGESSTLFSGYEQVQLLRPADIINLSAEDHPGGIELLLLNGACTYAGRPWGPGTWIRLPATSLSTIELAGSAEAWVKTGHLGG